MSTKAVKPEMIPALKETLRDAFWYKDDLKRFLLTCGINQNLISQLDWKESKRSLIAELIDGMALKQIEYGADLKHLIVAVANLSDPTWLLSVKDDGKQKYDRAVQQISSFKKSAKSLLEEDDARQTAIANAQRQKERISDKRNLEEKITKLKISFGQITKEPAQQRGYSFEKFLHALFEAYGIQSRSSYKIKGEQIDGAFVLNNTDFILEAKWHAAPIDKPDVVIFSDKVGNKLDNTLGLLISMSGFTPRALSGLDAHRPNLLLMDGGDIAAILERHIDLPDLLERKRVHASQTGEIMISAFKL